MAFGDQVGLGAHQPQNFLGIEVSGKAHDNGHQAAQEDGLHGGFPGALYVFFANPPGHHRSSSHAQSNGNRIDQRNDGFGQPDRGHRIHTDPGDIGNIDHGKNGLHHHFHDHGDGQHENRPAQAS